MSLTEIYRSGKTPKALYFAGAWLKSNRPGALARHELQRILRTWQDRQDAEAIAARLDFYFPLPADGKLLMPEEGSVSLHHPVIEGAHSVYLYDLRSWRKYFPAGMRLQFKAGDVFENPQVPTIIKARRLDCPGSENAIIFPLNTLRHFPHPHDAIPFSKKEPTLFFRGKIALKPGRIELVKRYYGHPGMDMADTGHSPELRQYQRPKVSIAAHFRYKYILVPEGNDVGSALGWVLGSNCVPVISKPQVEHWLMHSRLEAGRHYIEVAPDFSDLEEKLEWAESHPALCGEISEEGRRYYSQFLDSGREKIIALLILHRYFEATGQI